MRFSDVFNKTAHFGIGVFIGERAAAGDWLIAIIMGVGFLSYQIVERWVIGRGKGDRAYPEIKECLVGIGVGWSGRKLYEKGEVEKHLLSDSAE